LFLSYFLFTAATLSFTIFMKSRATHLLPMTAPIPCAEPLATATETLLESKRQTARCQADLKQAKLALKLAEKALKCAKKESRKATKLEIKAQTQLDDLRREIKTSKKRPGAGKAKDESEQATPPVPADTAATS
jgi:hypothetical protein